MIFDLMFRIIARRFLEAVMLIMALTIITTCIWYFLEAIGPYQVAQQAFYSG